MKRAHRVRASGEREGEDRHAEVLAGIVSAHPPQSEELLFRKPQALSKGPQIFEHECRIETIVPGGNRRMGRKNHRFGYFDSGLLKCQPPFLHAFCNGFQGGEGGVSLVQVKHTRAHPQLAEGAIPTDAKHQLLNDPRPLVAPIQPQGARKFFERSTEKVQEKERATPDLCLPDLDLNLPTWKFDLNPKDSKWVLGGRGTRNNIIATPVIDGDRVYLCVGQDPEHGEGVGHLYAIDGTKRGDITESGKVWHVGGEDFKRSMSMVAVADGLLYASDLSGFLYCLDAKTGKQHWEYDTFSAIWGSPYVVDGKVYLGNEDGEVLVFEHAETLKKLAANDMGNSVYTTPVASNGVLYVTNRRALFAIQGGK